MISVELAQRLAEALGRTPWTWEPSSGDRFVLPDRDIDDVFVVADMTIEVDDVSTGKLIRFNGTTEWALDSIPASDALWLPREHQLRHLLGVRFTRLERLPDDPGGFAVVLDDGQRHVDVDVEDAYARALLTVLD